MGDPADNYLMKTDKPQPAKYWSGFRANFKSPVGSRRQVRVLETQLEPLPWRDAAIYPPLAENFFREVEAPWLFDICARYNLGGMRFLGGDLAPSAEQLAHFLSRLLAPNNAMQPKNYPPLLAEAIDDGYLALGDWPSGQKKPFLLFLDLMSALFDDGVRVVLERPYGIYTKEIDMHADFILDGQEVIPGWISFAAGDRSCAVMVKTVFDYPQLTARLNRALGSWDFKYSEGMSATHFWLNGLDRESVLDLQLKKKGTPPLVGIDTALKPDPPQAVQTLLREIHHNITVLADKNLAAGALTRALMILNLGRLRWLEYEAWKTPLVLQLN